ncbi:virulence RhuM family protein [Patescibacteria group bacterium]|nr:virulence RhuM family protein [Patescibacteria group bacterium]MBU4347300.1 virulence RhuM family protein [Patescibacteria group bacterium]MBU4455512.1 virulence RhuM family protein [Patescibacteria group bacterium]
MTKKDFKKGEIVIYKTPQNEVELKVRFENESVWLRQNEIALLFGKERSVITKHINKIFADKEVDKKSNVQKMHIPTSDKPVDFYGLDVILAVGYRANSPRAIHFRKWATKILKQYLLSGYAINEKRLLEAKSKFHELQEAILFLRKQSKKELLKSSISPVKKINKAFNNRMFYIKAYDYCFIGL